VDGIRLRGHVLVSSPIIPNWWGVESDIGVEFQNMWYKFPILFGIGGSVWGDN
jgi:hypothetical protein